MLHTLLVGLSLLVPPPSPRAIVTRARFGRVICALPDQSFDEAFAEGSACVQSGEFGLALAAFRRANKMDPDHAPTKQLIEKLSALEMEDDDDDELEAELAAIDDDTALPSPMEDDLEQQRVEHF